MVSATNFSLLILSFGLSLASDYTCQFGYIPSLDNSMCFTPIAETSFTSAERICEQLNGHLPSISNAEINEQLGNITKKHFRKESFWIGLSSRDSWLDDSTSSYRHWAPGQPSKGIRQCPKSEVSGIWSMTDCSEILPFICSVPANIETNVSSFPPVTTSKPDVLASTNETLPLWVTITVSVILCLILLCCILWRCYYRFKKEIFEWKAFLMERKNAIMKLRNEQVSNDNQRISNQYDNVEEIPLETDDWEIEKENLTVHESELIGSGAFANVYLGLLQGEIPLVKRSGNTYNLGIIREINDRYKVAVKKLPRHASREGRIDFLHEIQFMKSLGYHPHVLSLLGVSNSVYESLIIVEYCENGDLLSFIRNRKDLYCEKAEDQNQFNNNVLTLKNLLSIAWQISDGMVHHFLFQHKHSYTFPFQNYLRSLNCVHRDIAARNILLNRYMSAKIGDFGLCRSMDSRLYTAKGGRLPIKWMAIESLKYYEYSEKSDVWSFGVLLYELFSLGQFPYATVENHEMPKYLEDGNRLPQTETCPSFIYEIMLQCWKNNPDERIDICQIREKFTILLNSESEYYGYVDLKDLTNEVCPI